MGRQNIDYVVKRLFNQPEKTYGKRNSITGQWAFSDQPFYNKTNREIGEELSRPVGQKDLEEAMRGPYDKPRVERALTIPLEVRREDYQRIDGAFGYKGRAYLCGVGTFIEVEPDGEKLKRYCEFSSYAKESPLVNAYFEDGPDSMDISDDGERLLFGRSHVPYDPIKVAYNINAGQFMARFDPSHYRSAVYR